MGDLSWFYNAAERRGLVLPPNVEALADGKLHRCAVEGGKAKDGAFLIFPDRMGGGIENHRDGGGWENLQSDAVARMNTADRALHQFRVEAMRRQAEADRKALQAETAEKARRRWDRARPAPNDHAYLVRKGIEPNGARVEGDNLLVPLHDETGALVNLQIIDPEGGKLFLPGGRKQGCWTWIGCPDGAAALAVAEGFATAATIHQATGLPVAVAFDCGNLLPVCKAIREAYHLPRIIVAADDDHATEGNPGLAKATEAADAIGASLAVPAFPIEGRTPKESDFNDLAARYGPEAVEGCIEAARDAVGRAVAEIEAIIKSGDPAALHREGVVKTLKFLQNTCAEEYTRLTNSIKHEFGHDAGMTDLRRAVREAAREDGGDDEGEADALLRLVTERCILFNTDREPYAAVDGECWAVEGVEFRRWVTGAFYRASGKAAGRGLDPALAAAAAIAVHDGPELAVHRRVARHGGAIYIDLADAARHVVRVDESGWSVEAAADAPVRFTRPQTMGALPLPERGGNVEALWELVNIPADSRGLALAGLVQCFEPGLPYAVLEFVGTAGCGKSWTQTVLHRLVDPWGDDDAPGDLVAMGKAADLWNQAHNGRCLSFNNASYLSNEAQDVLCQLTEGGTFATRKLYSNGEQFTIRAHCPVFVNGIVPVVSRGDLLDRALRFDLEPLQKRGAEGELRERFHTAKPRIFGALLDLLAAALRELPAVKANPPADLPRRADFAILGEALYRTLGRKPGAFVEDMRARQTASARESAEDCIIASAALRLVEHRRTWRGTVKRLLDEIEPRPDMTARKAGVKLRRAAVLLEKLGVRVEFGGRGRDGYAVRITNLHHAEEWPPAA